MIIKYGLFFIGLTDKGFYWEILVINIRKVVFIAVAVSLSQHSSFFQTILTFSTLFAYMRLVRHIKPYNKPYLNLMDQFSSLASILSLLVCMFFLEPKLKERTDWVMSLFIMTVSFNGIFILYWVVRMGIVLLTKINKLVVDRAER